MSENKIPQQLSELKNKLNEHNYHYYVLNAPIISDKEYDALLNTLKALETTYPELITPDSPTQRIGTEPSEKFSKVAHPAPILSLANAFDRDDLKAWLERVGKINDRVFSADFVVEPKLDGLTVVLHYRQGLFVQGTTRGNGEVGEDITTNLKTLRSIPLKIPVVDSEIAPPEYLVVRGEAFISLPDFDILNESLLKDGNKIYQNARNTAAGSLRQLDPAITASRPLQVLIYSIIYVEGGLVPETQWETLKYLHALGFPVPSDVIYCENIDDAATECENWIDKRNSLNYEVDGAVVKINNHSLGDSLGIVGKDPRGAIAFKFPAQEVTTQLLDIGVKVGRTGVITPFAILESVEVGGVIVRNATLHNFDFIEEKDIRIGDRVLIKRAGDVIPYVIGPIVAARAGDEVSFSPPTNCPACDQPVTQIGDEVAWYCVNPDCPEQLVRSIEHYVSRSTLDIVGMGIKIVEQLVNENVIQSIADLYTLTREQLLLLEGFAEKKADNLLASIENSKTKPLSRFIFALGIRGVGEVVGDDLANRFGDMDTLANVSREDLEAIEGIGPNIAKAIVSWFSLTANQTILSRLKKEGMWPKQKIKEDISLDELPLSGFIFVITGTLSTLSRKDAKDIIQANGGKVSSSVSAKTSYLLAGENPGSKLKKAESLGIDVIDEAGLQLLIGNNE